ncbi:PPE family protein [Mycobacterium kansasii 824]|uniref:PPE family protein n=1 Tax=Mycobacterium kansasii TaxID=1768 RepID=A0A1V3XJP0_MYCKA|nr:PPE family protein [Mycobacterium kansasii 824]OOK79434.1 PPE family protein [Mycobacterium kansasii]OOK80357.1 PPE family protein [Mycobacterium kansasii]
MIPEFAWLPPEVNSARIFAGAGSGPLHTAASAWESLAADLRASAASFDSVVSGLAAGPWSGRPRCRWRRRRHRTWGG